MTKILVIDDDALVRGSVARMLRRWGYDVAVAEDGRRGLALFHDIEPRLVITDIIMPDQDGIETIREIRRVRPDAQIIAMSGCGRLGNLDFLNIAAKLGAGEVISKPFEPATLRDCVTRCLAKAADGRPASEAGCSA
ncbi:MAG TPA: response regulator [Stellaceae bacterium]|nr:response regulator [Stellaceae bacterium]